MPTAPACWCGSIRSCCCGARWRATRRRWCRSSRPAAEPQAEGADASWSGDLLHADEVFVTGVGSSTTYPDYKPAPFIVGSKAADGVDMVTVVTEGIFSYCSFKVKIDTDRFLGAEQANVRYKGESIGHVTTAEYGSQMLSLGGVHHLTGGSKKEGRMTAELMQLLGNKKAIECTIDGGASLVIQAGRAPIVNGVEEQRMRVGCGSAAVGIFARQLHGLADEVVVVDDHITGVLTEHQAGRCLGMVPSGIQMRGRKSTPGRYFQVANPGNGWGGTDIADPLSIIEGWEEGVARPGLRFLMTSTTGEHAQWYVLDEALRPVEQQMPAETCAASSSASARTASPRSPACCFSAAPAAACAPASRRTRCCSRAPSSARWST